jgi:hypothetical protein
MRNGTRLRLPPRSNENESNPRRKNHRNVLHERKNSRVNAHACRAECGSYAARSSQKNP